MKCKCGFEIEKLVALKFGCLKCGDKSLIDLERIQKSLDKRKIGRKKKKSKQHPYKGGFKSIRDVSDETGIKYMTLHKRMTLGLTLEEAVNK